MRKDIADVMYEVDKLKDCLFGPAGLTPWGLESKVNSIDKRLDALINYLGCECVYHVPKDGRFEVVKKKK